MTDRQSNAAIKRDGFHWGEIAGLITLAGLTSMFLAFSWRKWPDPLIDFGTELYTPWRLASGAVLYRDVDCFYGPLSKYFNALIFFLFKPSLMVLVTANLIVFAAIVAILYLLCRRAWGIASALTACTIFIVLFGFSQFVGIGNYNYATPYCHEVTHGLLLCLLLTFVLVKWVENAMPLRSLLAGLLLGLTALLKPEILFAADVVTTIAVIQRCRSYSRPSANGIAAWTIGALLPSAGFAAYFSIFFPFHEALSLACRGWLSAVETTRLTGDNIQIGFLGLDQPWKHFGQHVFATFVACVLIALVAGAAWASEKVQKRWLSICLATALAGGMASLAYFFVNWNEIGRCLLGLVLLYLAVQAVQQRNYVDLTRRLIAVLAAAMMARMILNERIYQFGFYQAALAAVVIPAVLISELPRRLQLRGRGRAVLSIGIFALIVPGIVMLASQSVRQLQMKTLAVGEGADRFYAFPEQIEPTGKMVSVISEGLRQEAAARTLLVLPEGVMINYLARLPSTIAPFILFSAVTEAGGEEQIVAQLDRHPPDAVVIISRNLEGYGIARYGDRIGHGQLILRWIDENYNQVAQLGGDPFDYRERGAIIFKHR
jgi:hypothetical protein